MISAPMIYWWTGSQVINSTTSDIVCWLGPAMLSSMMFMGIVAGKTVFPLATDVTQLLSTFAVMRTVVMALIKPFGHPFKVTAKGLSTNGVTVQWRLLTPFLLMAAATALGMIVNMSSYSVLNGSNGYDLNVVWSVINIFVLCVAAAVCVELPKRRRDVRFPTKEPAILVYGASSEPCFLRNISLGGAALRRPDTGDQKARPGTIRLRDIPQPIPFETIAVRSDGIMHIRFDDSDETRHALIRKLFTGNYDNDVPEARIGHFVAGAVRKLFA